MKRATMNLSRVLRLSPMFPGGIKYTGNPMTCRDSCTNARGKFTSKSVAFHPDRPVPPHGNDREGRDGMRRLERQPLEQKRVGDVAGLRGPNRRSAGIL